MGKALIIENPLKELQALEERAKELRREILKNVAGPLGSGNKKMYWRVEQNLNGDYSIGFYGSNLVPATLENGDLDRMKLALKFVKESSLSREDFDKVYGKGWEGLI